jgi:hypothetical protein
MMRQLHRFLIPILLISASITMLVSALWNVGLLSSQIPFPADVETLSNEVLTLPDYSLTLELPKRIKLGSVEHLQLRLSPNTSNSNKHADIFSRFSLALESRLDLTGGTSTPLGLITAPITSGQTLVFVWNVKAGSADDLSGTIWIYLSVLPLEKGAGEELALYALPVEIPVTTILGLSTDVTIVLAGFGILISVVISAFIYTKETNDKNIRKLKKKRK